MTRIFRTVGLALVLATAALSGSASLGAAGTAGASPTSGDTPLPPGWELCVLQGVDAQVTQANVNDLDEWQAAEGGSTNNSAAFNPFNTRRTTDASGAPLPAVESANGFPAFATWTAGCAATVATLFQPNMWSITSALRAGNVAPAGAYLAAVDQSAWCAPSADGVPCYASTILGAAGAIPALLTRSSALDVFGNVKSDLRSYQIDVAAATSDQSALTTRQQGLATAEIHLSSAQAQFDAASRALRRFAIEEYVNNGLYASDSIANLGSGVKASAPQDADGVVAQQYLSIAASNLMARAQSAALAVKASISGRDAATRAVTLATLRLASADAAERQSLTQMVADMATMQVAGACTAVTITTPTDSVAAAGTPAATGPTTTVPSTTVPSTTVPSTTLTTTTTTTTLPTTTTTTTTIPEIPAIPPTTTTTTTVPPTTTTTTTVPPTTTTTTTPSTTTTTTVPGTPSTASPQSASPAGVAALQGCVAALAPPVSS